MGDGDGEAKEAGERWAALSPEELLSAAPPAPAASDSVVGSAGTSSGHRQFVGGHVNPRGYRWDVDNFVSSSSIRGMAAAWQNWRDVSVRGEVEVVAREDLDSWQKFAYDILSKVRRGVRVFLTGTAGTGKSRTVRSCVAARQKVIYEQALEEVEARSPAEAAKIAREAAHGSCVLAAPTGCASFQMKLGAATIHRIFGVPVGFCGPTLQKKSVSFLDRVRRLKAASLLVLDEFSMVGRKMLGKLVYRAREVFEDPRGEPFPDRDFVMAGDPKQAQPVGDEPMYKPGAYTGSDLNKPRKKQAPKGTPTAASLVDSGMLFRKSFDDVVLLREVHRVDIGDPSIIKKNMAAYAAEAERFLEVITKMADCEWDLEDYKFLQARNKSFLRRTPEGRRILEDFEGAPLLVDGKKKRKNGEDGAYEINMEELKKLSSKTKVPIAGLRAYHRYQGAKGDVKAENIDSDEFRGMLQMLYLCKGARVLLTHNEWTSAGLINGALGYVCLLYTSPSPRD